jgi:hypothetical protein
VSRIESTALKVALMTFTVFFASAISSCGYQGYTRYPCQEYANWQKPECNPPQCEAIGQCTKDLLPKLEIENG